MLYLIYTGYGFLVDNNDCHVNITKDDLYDVVKDLGTRHGINTDFLDNTNDYENKTLNDKHCKNIITIDYIRSLDF